MDLGDGGGCQGGFVKCGKDGVYRLAQGGFYQRAGLRAGERRHFVLQLAQFGEQVGREQVGAGGEGLPQFDEDGAEVL